MNHKIGLVEALCGFQFMLKHLDGRQIVVKYPAGKVIEPGKRTCVLRCSDVSRATWNTSCHLHIHLMDGRHQLTMFLLNRAPQGP